MSSLIGQTFCSLLLTARKIPPFRSYSQQRYNCPRSTFNKEKLTGSAFPMGHLLRESVQQMRIFGRSTTGRKSRATYHNWQLQAKRNVKVLVLYYQTQTNTVTSTLQLCKSFDSRKLLLCLNCMFPTVIAHFACHWRQRGLPLVWHLFSFWHPHTRTYSHTRTRRPSWLHNILKSQSSIKKEFKNLFKGNLQCAVSGYRLT